MWLEKFAAWAQRPMVLAWATYFLLIEAASWITASTPGPCVVDPAQYGDPYAASDKCPTFHVFLIKLAASVLEILGSSEWDLAIFTGVLAISTICLWSVTRKAANAARDAAEHIPATERAYVYGGPGDRDDVLVPGGPVVVFTIANYGKTPARTERVDWGLTETWPPADYARHFIRRDVLFPNMTGPIRWDGVLERPSQTRVDIFYGVITYRDVFDIRRFSCWIHEMTWIRPSHPFWGDRALDNNAREWTDKENASGDPSDRFGFPPVPTN